MNKNILLLVMAMACMPLAFADDASDTMAAALEQQAQSQETAAPALSTPAAPAVTAASTPEPVKAKDVLPPEENAAAVNEEVSDEEGASAKPDAKGALLEAAAQSGQLMLADFDTGDKPNNLGGDFGGFAKDPNDDTQDCRATFASDDALGNMDGFALRLDYDVDSPSPAYNGFWMKLENLNATPYDTLSFQVRGASKRFTKRLKVELKTPDHRSSSFFISGITDQWKKIEIPLKRFKGIKDWSILSELVLVFDDVNTAPKKGTLLVDQIMLERKEKGMPVISVASEMKPVDAGAPESLPQPTAA